MNGINLYASLGDHPSGDRAVDSARQKKGCVSVGADGHAADCGNVSDIQVSHIAYFYIQAVIRVMNIHPEIRIRLEDAVSDFLIDGGRIHWIPFIAAPGLDFKGAGQITCHFHSLSADGLKIILGHFKCRTDAVNSENLNNPFHTCIRILHAANKYSSVMHMNIRTISAQSITYFSDQSADEIGAVQSFQKYFSVSNQNQILHAAYPPVIFCYRLVNFLRMR